MIINNSGKIHHCKGKSLECSDSKAPWKQGLISKKTIPGNVLVKILYFRDSRISTMIHLKVIRNVGLL